MENLDTLNRSQLEEYFVNLYRKSWGSNAGLSSERIKSMSNSYLKTCIRSQLAFQEL